MAIYKFKIYYGSGYKKPFYINLIDDTINFLKNRIKVSDNNHQIIFLNELKNNDLEEIKKKLVDKTNKTYSNLYQKIIKHSQRNSYVNKKPVEDLSITSTSTKNNSVIEDSLLTTTSSNPKIVDVRIPVEIVKFIDNKIEQYKEKKWNPQYLEELKSINDLNKIIEDLKKKLESKPNNKEYKEVLNFIIINKLKNYFDNKIKQLDNQNEFTNKIINNNNEIKIEDYLINKELNWNDYLSDKIYNQNIYLNFNLFKFIKNIFEDEIKNNKTNNNNNKINENNYLIIYKLIIKLKNINNLKSFNFISIFLTDQDINNIVELIFENKINEITNKHRFVIELFQIYTNLHFKINQKNFDSLTDLIFDLEYDFNELDNFDELEEFEEIIELENEKETYYINNNYLKISYFRKLLYIFYYNKEKLKSIDYKIKKYIIDEFKSISNNDTFIIMLKTSNEKDSNTKYKFSLYLLYSILYLLDDILIKENNEIKKTIEKQISIIFKDYKKNYVSSIDENVFKTILSKLNINFKKEYYDQYNINPYDFYIEEKNILIELDGIFHFTLTLKEDGSLIHKYNIKDLIKSDLAKKLNYKMLRITGVYNAQKLENLYYLNFNGKLLDESPKNTNIYLENVFNEDNNIIKTDLDSENIPLRIQKLTLYNTLKNDDNLNRFKLDLLNIFQKI